MATSRAPKSILKKAPTPYATQSTSKSREDHNREVALYHANLIQARKDVELEILLSTEELIDYPLAGPPFSASNPSPDDAESFKKHLRPFQPPDYDALIQERNINEHCGYALCPNRRAKDGQGGKFRLVGMYGKAKDFRVVERWEVEKWCSEECARRALYVRVQLGDGPAWERGGYGGDVDLLDEPKRADDVMAERLGAMDLDDGQPEEKMQNERDLALERGDRGFAAKNGLVDFTIKENMVQGPVRPPTLGTGDLTERLKKMTIEGYATTFGRKDGGEDFDEDTDWKL